MSRDDPLFHDLRDLPPHVRRPAIAGRWVFGSFGAVGAIALVIHTVVFFTAWHYAASSPAGDQMYRLTDHGHSVYVGYVVHEVIKILAIIMIVGLGIGVPGCILIDALVKRYRRGTTSP